MFPKRETAYIKETAKDSDSPPRWCDAPGKAKLDRLQLGEGSGHGVGSEGQLVAATATL